MIVLDTHVWVWWVSNPKLLSPKARRAISAAVGRSQVHISSISVWELALLSMRGRLKLKMDVGDWIAQSEALPFLHFVTIDNHIALKSTQLDEPLHYDPADRIIIATALSLGAALVTKDQKIRDYPHVTTIW